MMYGWLDRVANVGEVVLAHPYGVRAFAAPEVKTDGIAARERGEIRVWALRGSRGGRGAVMGLSDARVVAAIAGAMNIAVEDLARSRAGHRSAGAANRERSPSRVRLSLHSGHRRK